MDCDDIVIPTQYASEHILDWEANQRIGERIGNRHPWLAPQGCYRCEGDDACCVVSVHDDTEWAALCGVIGQPELAHDPRFATNDARMRNHDAIDTIISAWTGGVSKFQAMDRLQAAGVRFRSEMVQGVGGNQALVEDPSGNLVELFQPIRPEARLG